MHAGDAPPGVVREPVRTDVAGGIEVVRQHVAVLVPVIVGGHVTEATTCPMTGNGWPHRVAAERRTDDPRRVAGFGAYRARAERDQTKG